MKKLAFRSGVLALMLIQFAFVQFAEVAWSAEVGSPLVRVQAVIAELRLIVKENTGKMSEPDIDKALENKVKPLFDFNEMARRSLGTAWNKITADEQKEFVALFSDLLSRTYLARIRDGVRNSEIVFGGEKLKERLAIVDTEVMYKGDKLAVNYRLYQKDSKWLVYDVVIENVGIVSNYRDEFAVLMRKGGFSAVMERLHSKELIKAPAT